MTYTIDEITESATRIGLSKSIVKALIENLPNKRSSQQNRSLHLLFTNIAFELNRLGLEFTYTGIKGLKMQTTYSPEIVKDFLWRPLQIALIGKESTTKLTSADIESIFLILGRWFSEQGVVIEFPSIETLINKTRCE
jgi:hypothetical protein